MTLEELVQDITQQLLDAGLITERSVPAIEEGLQQGTLREGDWQAHLERAMDAGENAR